MVMKEGDKNKNKSKNNFQWDSGEAHIGDMLINVKGYLKMFAKKITRSPGKNFKIPASIRNYCNIFNQGEG